MFAQSLVFFDTKKNNSKASCLVKATGLLPKVQISPPPKKKQWRAGRLGRGEWKSTMARGPEMKQWKHTAAEGAGHPPQLPPPAQSQPPLPRRPPGSSDLRLLDKHTDVLNPGEGNGRAIFCNKIRSKGQDQRTSCLLITTGMDNL